MPEYFRFGDGMWLFRVAVRCAAMLPETLQVRMALAFMTRSEGPLQAPDRQPFEILRESLQSAAPKPGIRRGIPHRPIHTGYPEHGVRRPDHADPDRRPRRGCCAVPGGGVA